MNLENYPKIKHLLLRLENLWKRLGIIHLIRTQIFRITNIVCIYPGKDILWHERNFYELFVCLKFRILILRGKNCFPSTVEPGKTAKQLKVNKRGAGKEEGDRWVAINEKVKCKHTTFSLRRSAHFKFIPASRGEQQWLKKGTN